MSQSSLSFQIEPVSKAQDQVIQQKIDLKTKPPGALGQLESLALQIARIQGPQQLQIVKPTMLVFAGDHGIAAEGVSIAPSEVTHQMVQNFAHGGAAINVFCRQLGFTLEVIDCGILTPVEGLEGIIDQRLGAGTAAIHLEPAMPLTSVDKGFDMARELIERHHQAGCNLVAFGEMGIGNTSSAAAIMAAIMQLDVADCVGRGTGINSDTLARKLTLVELALLSHQSALSGPKQVLACLGGFEIVQMTGAMLAAAERRRQAHPLLRPGAPRPHRPRRRPEGHHQGAARDAGQHRLCPDCPARRCRHLSPPCAQGQHTDQYVAREKIARADNSNKKAPIPEPFCYG